MCITLRRASSSALTVLTLLLPLCAANARQASRLVPLTSLDLGSVTQGFGKPAIDRSVDGNPIRIGGKDFAHGLGTHSPGSILISLDGSTRSFTGSVGIDDEVGKKGSARFLAIADGRTLFDSAVMHGGDAAKPFHIDLARVRQLLLVVDDAGDGYNYDHAIWADANFEVAGANPRALPAVAGNPPVIATNAAPHAPRINSPRTAGGMPGAEFIYNICAEGAAPVSVAVDHLPPGLRFDAASGAVVGRLAGSSPAEFRVTARNRFGLDRVTVRVVPGSPALTPPLGWNSYDSYGDDVTEQEILANAAALKQRLQPHGWEYVVVDYRWYDPGAATAPNNPNVRAGAEMSMDANGRLTPAVNRFPSAAGDQGFGPLAARLHAMGLKFGIHIMRGIPRQAVARKAPIEGSAYRADEAANTASICGWCPDMYGVRGNTPAGQAYYESLMRLYARWGLDFIKVDDISAPYSADEIAAIHRGIERCGRNIVLSLSPGEAPVEQAAHVHANANMWRISGDFWDDWASLTHAFSLLSRWQGLGGPGHWPDEDMIPIGRLSVGNRSVGKDRLTGFSRAEQVTLMTLWALAPSPLMLGGNLPDNDAWTWSLLTNDDVLAVNQDALGAAARLLDSGQPGFMPIWAKKLSDGTEAIGLFNQLPVEARIKLDRSLLALRGPVRLRDLWKKRDIGAMGGTFTAAVPAHGAVFLRAIPAETPYSASHRARARRLTRL